jgi:serine phosphatase RsbU (regulator of sigma subunit)
VSAGTAPKVDLSVVASDGTAADLLRQAAEVHAAPLFLADAEGTVVGVFAPAGWEGKAPGTIPVDAGAAAREGLAVRPVVVYDAVCGHLAAGAPGVQGKAAARFAADLLAALGTRHYETESLSQSLLDSFEEVNLFYGITARLHRVGGSEGICRTILARACEIVKAARASILLADPHTGVMRIVASQGIPEEQVAAIRVQPGEGVVGRVMDTGQAVIVDDAGSLDGARREDTRYASRSFISVPVRVFDPDELSGARRAAMHRRSLGVLNMTDKAGGGPFTSGDLKLLSALSSQAAVLLDNTRLAGIEKEMGLARTIQASLLPQAPPAVPGAELAGVCFPARNVGGDYFDLLALPGGRSVVLVADVSGHNVGAALMMAVSRAALRAEIDRAEEPDEILARVNRLLDSDLGRSELFVSVFLAVFDPATGDLSYASAGHNPGMLRRAGGGAVEELDAEGILLGVLPEFRFERRSVRLRPGDLLLLFTDGLTEARDAHGEMFGEARLAEALEAASARPTAEIPGALLASIDRFTGTAPADDRTVAVLRAVRMPAPGGGTPGEAGRTDAAKEG